MRAPVSPSKRTNPASGHARTEGVGHNRAVPTQVATGAGARSWSAPSVLTVSDAQVGIWPWTQTGMSIGMIPDAQIQSIAGTLTRTHPCDAA